MTKFVTSSGKSGSGKSLCFGIYLQSTREYVGSAYTVDGGERWFIRGLFREVRQAFSDSQTAIEQAVFLYEQKHSRPIDKDLMKVF